MDAESVSGHLLPPGSVFAFLAAHRRELFPDAMFADLFPSPLGRPSVPADVMATVLVLQALQGPLGSGGGRGADVRSAVEGRLRMADRGRRVPSDGPPPPAPPAGPLPSPAPPPPPHPP